MTNYFNTSHLNNTVHAIVKTLSSPKFHYKLEPEKKQTPHLFDSNYPPCNLLELQDGNLLLEIAVTGIKPEDVSLHLDGTDLIISTNASTDDTVEELTVKRSIHTGLAMRTFTRRFPLSNSLEVSSKVLKNGLLSIGLKKIVPETLKSSAVKLDISVE